MFVYNFMVIESLLANIEVFKHSFLFLIGPMSDENQTKSNDQYGFHIQGKEILRAYSEILCTKTKEISKNHQNYMY